MSLRRAARVFACVAFVSLTLMLPAGAEDAAQSEHVPELTTRVYQVADLIVPLATDADADDRPNFEWLLDLIELRTGADCWKASGGYGVMTPHDKTMSLVVRQTQATHDRIADVLDEIRGTGDLAMCVEVQVIHGNLDACDDAKPHRTAEGLVDAAGKLRLLKLAQTQPENEVWFAPKITFFNGQAGSIEQSNEHRTTKLSVRGVISRDNRYSRLWLDASIDAQSASAEVLVPEGCTAVRKLPGDNNWMLVTSHVLNAEEPQVIAPVKAEKLLPVEQKKRYLVPVDESPEPTELTGVPQFKAQAEKFGLAVQRMKGALETGAENAAATADAEPELAVAVERVEYQVAQAEPGGRAVDADQPPPPPKAVSSFEMDPLKPSHREPEDRISGLTRRYLGEGADAPYRLWIGDMLENAGFAQDDRCVVHTVNVEPAVDEPPARLDVCLDDAECQPAPWAPVQLESPRFNGIFVTPLPTAPMRSNGQSGRVSQGSITFDHWKAYPSVTISHVEGGRRAILTQPKSREVSGFIVDCQPAPTAGTPHIRFEGNDLVFVSPHHSFQVQQASGVEASIATLDSHLKAAESTLDKLGLDAEEQTIRSLRQKIRQRAEERCQEIDREITRLKQARERLEKLARPEPPSEAAGRTQFR